MTMKLYDRDVSGNCYKVRLLCSLLNVPVELIEVDTSEGAHKRSPLIDLNAFGQLQSSRMGT
jgi:glutathione S-transferase